MQLTDAIDAITTAKRAAGRAERTVADYRRVLDRFTPHVPADGAPYKSHTKNIAPSKGYWRVE